jgi:hypothetical protein
LLNSIRHSLFPKLFFGSSVEGSEKVFGLFCPFLPSTGELGALSDFVEPPLSVEELLSWSLLLTLNSASSNTSGCFGMFGTRLQGKTTQTAN